MVLIFFIFCLTQTCNEESNAAELEPLVTPLSSYLGPAECRHADIHGLNSGGSGWPRCVIQTHSVFCLPLSQTWGSALQRSHCLLGHIEPVASEVKIISKHHTYLCKCGNLHFSTLKSHIRFIEFVTGSTAFYPWHSAPAGLAQDHETLVACHSPSFSQTSVQPISLPTCLLFNNIVSGL